MPKLLAARPPRDEVEARRVRKLAGSRHAPADWIQRAQMVALSWEGLRVPAIASELRCHAQTVRERLVRFNAAGIDGLGDRPGAGRRPRLAPPEAGRPARSVWCRRRPRQAWRGGGAQGGGADATVGVLAS